MSRLRCTFECLHPTTPATSTTSSVAGIVLTVGIVALNVMNHMLIEYDMYARLETLEGKK